MEVSTPKTEGKFQVHDACNFSSVLVWIPPSTQNILLSPYHFISMPLNVNYDFDISVATYALPGKAMQKSTQFLTNENERYNEIK